MGTKYPDTLQAGSAREPPPRESRGRNQRLLLQGAAYSLAKQERLAPVGAGSARELPHTKAEVAIRGCSYKEPPIHRLNKSASPL